MILPRLLLHKHVQALIIFAVVFAASAYISLCVYKNYPMSQDEYAYVYQAKIFSQGQLYLPVDKSFRPFVEREMRLVHKRLYSKYPPGTSALLSLGELAGYPGLVNPFLSALSTVLILLTLRHLVSGSIAFIGAFFLGTNPYFLGYGSSYFSQAPSLFFAALGFWAVVRNYKHEIFRSWMAGLAVACNLFIRQLDAFCLMCSLLVMIVKTRRSSWHTPVAIVGVLSGGSLLLLCFAQYLISGRFQVAMQAGVWYVDFPLFHQDTPDWLDNILQIIGNYFSAIWLYELPLLTDYFSGLVGPALLIGVVLGLRRPQDALGKACITFIISIVALYNVHNTLGWVQYGARYWYPLLVPLMLLAMRGYASVSHAHAPRIWACLIIFLFAWQSVTLGFCLKEYSERLGWERHIQKRILKTCPPGAVVVLDDLYNLKRNPLIGNKGLRLRHNYGHRKFILKGQNHMPEPSDNMKLCPYPPE